MYDFLENIENWHLIIQMNFCFTKKIIDYLEESLQDYYELDGTDVF